MIFYFDVCVLQVAGENSCAPTAYYNTNFKTQERRLTFVFANHSAGQDAIDQPRTALNQLHTIGRYCHATHAPTSFDNILLY